MRFGDLGTNSNTAPVNNEPISLQKGQAISLTKVAPGLKKAMIGLGWDVNDRVGADFDLDASCFLLDSNDRADGIESFIFYNHLSNSNGSVVHQGDNTTGLGDGDDEKIMIDFDNVPANVNKIAITITIYDADSRRQNFGMVHNSFARVVNMENNQEMIHFDLGEEFSTETAIIAVEFYRYNGEWKMKGVSQGYAGGLKALGQSYGLNIA